jgi:serine/threonine-protein kinase HipA
MDREVLVYVDLDGVQHLTGRLWSRLRKNKESATFEYDPDWLRHPARFALEPARGLSHRAGRAALRSDR